MTYFHRLRVLVALLTLSLLTLAACATPAPIGHASATSQGEPASVLSGGLPPGDGSLASLRIATLFSGSVSDGDFSHLGLQALESAEDEGAGVAYAEKVAVTDAEQTIRGYVADGYNVIWTHGGQYLAATAKVAADHPDVDFIAETEGRATGLPANVWTLDWQFHLGFYAVGVLAAKLSHTGRIGYVGGLPLPFTYGEVHAMQQAIRDLGLRANVAPVWTGDFNDPVKAQRITQRLIDDGADVIVGSLNNGSIGTFEAAGAASGDVWVTAKYTDKSALSAGSRYAGSVTYDFTPSLLRVLSDILDGKVAGYYPVTFSSGVTISMPDAVPVDVRDAVTDTMRDLENGSIAVILDTGKIG